MLRVSSLLGLATLALALLAPGRASSAELQVNPVVVRLSALEKSTVVALRNQGKAPARFEVKVYAWEQSRAGEMKLGPTEDVVAFPGVLSLAPGETRNLRVGSTTSFAASEKTYRIFIEELPPPPSAEETTGVQMLSRIGLPVFLVPSRRVETLEVEGLRLDAKGVSLSVVNRGTVHVRPTAVTLVARDAAGAKVAERALEAWYVLAGGARDHLVELPAADCGRIRSLAVEVKLEGSTVRGAAEVPAGACGP